MSKHNIGDYDGLQEYYRGREKKMLQGRKKAIYWANEDINLAVEPDDIIQWWGETRNI